MVEIARTSRPRRVARASDPRSQRSRERLRDALLRLVQDRPLETVTLRDIASEAGVSYPTVFNHYEGREDLFREIAREEALALLEAFRRDRTSPDWRPGKGITAHVLEHRGLWLSLLADGANDAMRAEFIRQGRKLAADRPRLSHDVPVDVVSGLIASGIFEIVSWWLAQEPETPAGSVANMLERLVIEPALDLARGYFADR